MKKIKCTVCKLKCLLNVTNAFAVYNSDWKGQQLGNTISIWNAWKFELILLARLPRETHVFKKVYRSSIYKKEHFNLFLLACACAC